MKAKTIAFLFVLALVFSAAIYVISLLLEVEVLAAV